MTRKRRQANLTGLGEEIATDWERAVVLALQELAPNWPPTVMLASMDGGLQVVRTDLYRRGHDQAPDRVQHHDSCVLANIDGIPNDGGGW
jgi:hypothetical protein